MRKSCLALLLACCLLALTGCSSLLEREYRSVSRHVSQTVRVEVQDGIPILVKNIGLPTERQTGLIKAIQLSLMRFADVDEDIYALRAEDDENVYAV